MIACVAVVGKRNELLYLETFLPSSSSSSSSSSSFSLDPAAAASSSLLDDPTLRFHFVAHSALDIFDERRLAAGGRKGAPTTSSSSSSQTQQQSEMYLGHLCPIEEFNVYGYQTSTQVKILAVVTEDGGAEPVRESEIKGVLQGLHTLYVSYLQSPFSPLGGKIVSDRFNKGVERQVSLYNQSGSGGGGGMQVPASVSSRILLASSSSLSSSISGSLPHA
jgi:hypothetical protein